MQQYGSQQQINYPNQQHPNQYQYGFQNSNTVKHECQKSKSDALFSTGISLLVLGFASFLIPYQLGFFIAPTLLLSGSVIFVLSIVIGYIDKRSDEKKTNESLKFAYEANLSGKNRVPSLEKDNISKDNR